MDLAALLAGRRRPAVMGILNVTPDSFSDGGLHFSFASAIDRGRRLEEEGADIIDIGGESTRPASYGLAQIVAPEEEIRRTAPVIQALGRSLSVPISIDTRRARVAREAIAAGASIINDVTAFQFDSEMPLVAAESGAAAILMHMRGTDPRQMQAAARSGQVVNEIAEALSERAECALRNGIDHNNLAVDPGLGFGKTPEQNLDLLRDLSRLCAVGFPVVVGASRKAFVRRYSGISDDSGAEARLPGSLACAAAAAERGAAILRVHDVAATVDLLNAHAECGTWMEAARRIGLAAEPFDRMYRAIVTPPRADVTMRE